MEDNRESGGRDEKTLLQEKLQENGAVDIRYELISQQGPPHDRTFVVQVYCEDRLLAQGTGKSKKAAQKEAAHRALADMNKEDQGEA